MSTRSVIGITDRNGDGQLIYCHFDGYPEGAGLTLLQHWQDESKVRELMALGDLSMLSSEIGEQVEFDTFHGSVFTGQTAHPNYGIQCLAYGRDRGEVNIEAASFIGGCTGFLDCAKARHSDVEYGYLWTPDGWFGTELPHEWISHRVSNDTVPVFQSLGSMVKASLDMHNAYLISKGGEPIALPEELANVA